MIVLNIFSHVPFQKEYLYRIISIFFATIGLLFLYKTLFDIGEKKIALLTIFLTTFNTLFQQYSQSATMYSLLFLFHSIIFYGYTKKRKGIEAFGLIGGLYTHYFTVITLLIILYLEYNKEKNNFIKTYWKKYTFIFICYLPWLYFFIPGLFFHKSKLKKLVLHINVYQFIFTFGISGVLAVIQWSKKYLKNLTIENTFQRQLNRFKYLSMFSFFVFLIILFISTPFLRYLYFLLPIWTGGILLMFDEISDSLSVKYTLLSKKVYMTILIVLLFIPNIFSFGIFPYSFSYHDAHDSIYHQHWKEIAKIINKRTVTIENIRSYYYYYRILFPEVPQQHAPWHNLGIHELKYNQWDIDYNIRKLKGIKTEFVALNRVGRGKPEIIKALHEMGYTTYANINSSVILRNPAFR